MMDSSKGNNKPSQSQNTGASTGSNNPNGATARSQTVTSGPGQSKSSFIREGWGNRVNFQASYGLRMTPEDIEEGDAILEGLMEHR